MSDLDKLFALVDLVSNPKAAKKNADDMKAILAEKAENSKLVKEANAVSFENAKEKEDLADGWAEVDKAREVLKEDGNGLAVERMNIESARTSAIAGDNKRKDKMKEIEASHAKKLSELKVKLAFVEASISDAKNRKELAETDLDRMRQRIG